MDYEEHPSWGVVVINRAQGTPRPLFGSSLLHQHTIELEIKEARYARDLSHDWIHGGQTVVGVTMSAAQFADAITSFGQGGGSPCTIHYARDSGAIKQKATDSKQHQFREEFEREMRELTEGLHELQQKANAVLDTPGTVKASDKKHLLALIRQGVGTIRGSIPYVERQFQKQTDRTIVEAKAELEAHIDGKLRSLGLEAMREQLQIEMAEPEAADGE